MFAKRAINDILIRYDAICKPYTSVDKKPKWNISAYYLFAAVFGRFGS